MKYLFDTNILVHVMRGRTEVASKFYSLDRNQRYISEASLFELYYGAEKSGRCIEERLKVDLILTSCEVVPMPECRDIYCREKVRLTNTGQPLEDFDIIIASSAILMGCVLVTEDVKHMGRFPDLKLENWVIRPAQ